MCAKDIQENSPEPPPEHAIAQLVMGHSSDGIVICGPDRKVLWVNPAFSAQTGYGINDLHGEEPGTILQGPDTDPATARQILIACRQRREVRVDILNYTADGQPFWVDLKITPIFDATGLHTHFISSMRDISDRKNLEQQNDEMRHAEALRQSERQLLALTSEWLYSAKSFDELLMVVQRAMHTLIPEAEGALYIYGAARSTLELATSWGSTPDFQTHMQPDDCWALRRGRAYAYGLKPIQFACDHVKNPATPYFCLPIIAHGETIGLLHIVFEGFEEGGLMRHMREEVLRNRWDVSLICAEQISLAIANVRLRQELHDQSMRDALTGLWNRRWFNDRASKELHHARAEGSEIAMIMFDVDHFKSFNDSYGHDAGDLVLQEVGNLLRTLGEPAAYACRMGGEEFVLLAPNMSGSKAVALADRVRASLSELSLKHAGAALPQITASAGLALYPQDGQSVDELMKAADQALYCAKDHGRNCTVTAQDVPALKAAHLGDGAHDKSAHPVKPGAKTARA
ncbi:MAG: diguanylate cyclase [Rhodobacteraceae bacterium]|nr:diguanylate cyclase [Paracoccaceae bacterium]